MNSNEELIQTFYSCFKKNDFKGMQKCYAEKAEFRDAVFGELDGDQVRAMWEMLCTSSKDFMLTYGNIKADATGGNAEWIALYTFSKTGNKVTNKVQARFEIKNGQIIRHTDTFNFYTWAKQAFGITGLLIGWTDFFKNKVRKSAKSSLAAFMRKKKDRN